MSEVRAVITVPDGMSQRAIARRAGVSVATVSRAINGSPLVSPHTRLQIQEAIRQLSAEGFGPMGAAGKSRRIALTNSHMVRSPESHQTMLQEILGGVEATAVTAGCTVHTVHQSGYLLSDQDNVFANIDGLLLVGGVVSTEVIDAVVEREIPTVLVGGHVPESPMPSVAGDVSRGTYLMVKHLAELGHRRIGFVNGPSETYTSFERRSGYLVGLADCGIAPDPDLIRWENGVSGFIEPAGERLTRQLLDLPERPTAIIYAADTSALGGSRAIRDAGLRIPDDISIVGFDDSHIARAMSPPLTTVSVDRVEWGAMAFYRLLRLLDGEKSFAGDRLLLPVTVQVRESTTHLQGAI